MAELLLEIKVEDIPAPMQQPYGEQGLLKGFYAFAEEVGLTKTADVRPSYKGAEVSDIDADVLPVFLKEGGIYAQAFSTPGRLTLWVQGLPERTPDTAEERRGPRADAAFAPDGTPTPALQGFMRSCGVTDPTKLERRQEGKAEFLFFSQRLTGRPMEDVLAEKLPALITGLHWPKSMRWGSRSLAFIRPIESILALFDGDVVPFDVDGIQAANRTYGHFFLYPEPFKVSSAESYFEKLAKHKVILKRADRKALIRKLLNEAAQKAGAKLVPNEGLIDEVTGLVEYPYAVTSKFDPMFLELPREVLELTMASHQRNFALEDASGKLTNTFLGISNMADETGAVASGYAKVITARFNDARFYWQTDKKQPLESRLSALEKMVFHQSLGTVADKVRRLQNMMPLLAPFMKGLNADQAKRAALLAKCDLNTGVVYEFPELQGIMGAYYAAAEGEPEDVTEALRTQYEIADFEDMGPVAQALILADRLDTLVGFFGINQPPTGSKDPYALRRAALSIIRLLRTHTVRLPLRQLITTMLTEKALYGSLSHALTQTPKDTQEALVAFFMDRLKVVLKEEGIAHDRVDAVFVLGLDDVVDVANRAHALHAFMGGVDGAALHAAFRRACNILDALPTANKASLTATAAAPVNPALFEEDAERQLWKALTAAVNAVQTALKTEDYEEAMTALTRLRQPVDAFFTDVMVMAENEAVRQNRLSLLTNLHALFMQVADLGKVVAV